MAAILEELRPFVVGRHTNLDWRKQQLEILRAALIEEKDASVRALHSDLHVDEAQAVIFQLGSIFGDLDVVLDSIDGWVAPQRVTTPLPLQPASCEVQAQPKGVVLVLGPWNYPFNTTIGPVISALAAGNCVVVKPSEHAPESAKVMERIFQRLDQRGVRCLLGGMEVSSNLTALPFDHIVFTGNPRIGKMVLAAAATNLTPVTLELGGKCPVVVAKGTRLVEACRRIISNKFTNKGQTCIAPDYVLVERSICDEVIELLVNNVKETFGDKPHLCAHLGRTPHAAAARRLLHALKEDHGGKVLFGGEVPEEEMWEKDRFVPPTVILNPKQGSQLVEEEIFGPILPVHVIDSYTDAIEYINAKPKPLALYVFGPTEVERSVVAKTSSGQVVMGDLQMQKGNPHLPFGGIGYSGMGRLHGKYGFEELSHLRAVMKRSLTLPSPLRHPIDPRISKALWIYASTRPGRYIRKYFWKLLLVLFVALPYLRSAARRRVR